MYSFEGEFRRRPQQNLAGASAYQNLSRDALLKKAHQDRVKREEYRRRLYSAIKIQSVVRSFLYRIRSKNNERLNFDSSLPHHNPNSEAELLLLMRRILFFYDQKKDSSRLIFVSQQLLKQWSKLLQNVDSFVQIRRLLALHLKFLNTRDPQSRDSLAVPLRMLEVFTCHETAKKIMSTECADNIISKTLLYLVKNGFFREIRKLLEDKTPPLYGPSASPPTPLAASLFVLLLRPFYFVKKSEDDDYSNIVMLKFSSCILCPEMSEVVKLFLLPALKEQPISIFPYNNLITSFNVDKKYEIDIDYSSWLLYSLLFLEPKDFINLICDCPSNQRTNTSFFSHPRSLKYLELIAHLTSNLLKKSTKRFEHVIYNDQYGYEGDSDSEPDEVLTQRESTINVMCIEMMNDSNSCILQACAQAGQNDWKDAALEQISAICHHLLLSYKLAVHKYKLLSTLAFKPWFLKALWNWASNLELKGSASSSTARGSTLLVCISQGLGSRAERLLPPLATFSSLYSLLLATLHDEELMESDLNPIMRDTNLSINSMQAFSLTQLGPLCVTLRQVCMGLIELAFPELRPNVAESFRNVFAQAHQHKSDVKHEYDKFSLDDNTPKQTTAWSNLFKVSVRLLRQLHTRDQRLNFTRGESDWCGGTQALPLLIERPHHLLHPRRNHSLRQYRPFTAFTALTREDCDKGPPLTIKEVRTLTILKEIPFVVPFSQRVLIFQGLIMRDKQEYQGDLTNFLQGPSIDISIRRSHIYEDAFTNLNSQNEQDLRHKMRVQLVNEAGLEEAGVDGGGVFREFLSELLRMACDPNRGFFRLTKDNMLYPNPAVHLLLENFQRHYYFIGRMLGKAMYEGLLIELPLAEFFLQAVVGEERGSEGEADIHRLAALDERLHRSLLQLRAMSPSAVADLGLDFTIMSDELGEQRLEELKPNGGNIAVNTENRIEYIHLVAEWKLSRQVRAQVTAVRKGLETVVPLAWLRIFCARELRLLISGAESSVDVDDLKMHTNYAGGYCGEHPTIKIFWKVVENFSDIQKRLLLKFVTSCSRPPLLGFKDLEPMFCIQYAGTSERLPSASTCMNLLKLPEFPNETVMKEKLLYAINAGAGFELS